jgi:hypothetical protein
MKQNKIFLAVLWMGFVVSAQDLDFLMTSSAEQVRQYDMVPLLPPKNFAKNDAVLPHVSGIPHSLSLSSIASQAQMVEMEKRIRDLEINVTKVTVILENMQKVNEKHSDKFDVYMKFFEAIITAIAGIVTALIGVYIKGRKK